MIDFYVDLVGWLHVYFVACFFHLLFFEFYNAILFGIPETSPLIDFYLFPFCSINFFAL